MTTVQKHLKPQPSLMVSRRRLSVCGKSFPEPGGTCVRLVCLIATTVPSKHQSRSAPQDQAAALPLKMGKLLPQSGSVFPSSH